MRRLSLVIAGLAACGGGSSTGGGGGSSPDASVPLPDGIVTVSFPFARYDQYGPALFCRDAAGAVIETVAVPHGADPITASCHLPEGGSVDVLTGVGDFAEFTSFRDIAPGDTIALGYTAAPEQVADTTTMTIDSATAIPAPASSCGAFPTGGFDLVAPPDTSTSWVLTGATPCESAPIDLLFVDSYDAPTHYAWQPDVTYLPNGTFTLGALQPLTSAALDIANVPAGLGHLSVEVETRVGSAAAFSYGFDRFASFENPAAGAQTATLPDVGSAGRGTRLRFESGIGISVVDEREIVTADGLDGLHVDFAEQPLPIPRGARITGNTITWIETASGTGDLRHVYATREAIAANGPAIEWHIYSDPTDGALAQTIYPLPDAYAAYDWTRGTSATVPPTVLYVDSDQTTGWAEAKSNPMRVFDIEYAYAGTASRGHRTLSN
jgi:hypothetical protein